MSGRIFIIDTNVVVAGLITADPSSPTARLLDAMLDGRLIFLLSPALLFEYREVLLRPRITILHGLSERKIEHFLTEITANAVWRDPLPETDQEAPDPNDEHLWTLLAVEPTSILITGDRLLLENPRPQSAVISPATWVEQSLK